MRGRFARTGTASNRTLAREISDLCTALRERALYIYIHRMTHFLGKSSMYGAERCVGRNCHAFSPTANIGGLTKPL